MGTIGSLWVAPTFATTRRATSQFIGLAASHTPGVPTTGRAPGAPVAHREGHLATTALAGTIAFRKSLDERPFGLIK